MIEKLMISFVLIRKVMVSPFHDHDFITIKPWYAIDSIPSFRNKKSPEKYLIYGKAAG